MKLMRRGTLILLTTLAVASAAWSRDWDSVKGSFDRTLTVTGAVDLEVRTGSGDINVEGLHGTARLESGSGNMSVASVQGDLRVRTGSGDGKIRNVSGGRIEITTGSGDFEIRDVQGTLELRTGAGDITAEGKPTGEWRVETGSGQIRVHLPSDLGFELDAHTSSGDISTGLPVTVTGTVGHGSMRGKVRGGGVL